MDNEAQRQLPFCSAWCGGWPRCTASTVLRLFAMVAAYGGGGSIEAGLLHQQALQQTSGQESEDIPGSICELFATVVVVVGWVGVLVSVMELAECSPGLGLCSRSEKGQRIR